MLLFGFLDLRNLFTRLMIRVKIAMMKRKNDHKHELTNYEPANECSPPRYSDFSLSLFNFLPISNTSVLYRLFFLKLERLLSRFLKP